MEIIGWVALVVALVSMAAWRLTYTAARLDRLHGRVEGTMSALDAQLVRRAEASLELVRSDALDPTSALVLGGAATSSLELADEEAVTSEVRVHGISPERGEVESALSEALEQILTPETIVDLRDRHAFGQEGLEIVYRAGQRVQLSRRFYNDAVRDVRRVRAKRFVRWFRLAGHTAMPESVEFNDFVPEIRQV
ncbi:hypothetical protein [Luteipulveratus mongoliensis]|uniref:LemA family protein n=1 Tax=Luteipulveratus mongoliensis TaxID=571913 RepID=A0A0K1JJX2_9MICO|nr:hypothetical protein [Luteipulveratus mongoliensis]AKU16883.1 hypothetical protein VV02_15095 [Luteipulveratus mongoliensis]